MSGCRIGDEEAVMLAQTASLDLLKLDLSNNFVGDKGCAAISDLVAKRTALTHLSLEKNVCGQEGLACLLDVVSRHPSLVHLSLDFVFLGDEGAGLLGRAVKDTVNLRSVCISGAGVGADGAQLLAAGLGKSKSVTSVDLSSNCIGLAGCKAIANFLTTSKRMMKLDLSNCQIDFGGAVLLASALEKNVSLTSLNLSHNSIGKRGGMVLARSLASNLKLSSLDLSSCMIEIEGTRALATSLEGNRAMTSLNLTGNDMSSDAHRSLVTSLKRNASLQEYFFEFARSGNLDMVKLFLLQGVDASRIHRGQTVFHAAIEFNKWQVVEVLLEDQVCRALLDEVEGVEKSARKAILDNCPSWWRARIFCQLPGVKISLVVDAFEKSCLDLHLEWNEVDRLLNDNGRELQARTQTALRELGAEKIVDELADLAKIEAVPATDRDLFQARHGKREQVLRLIMSQSQAVASYLHASSCELDVLASIGEQNLTSTVGDGTDVNNIFGRAFDALQDILARKDAVAEIKRSIKDKAATVDKLFHWDEARSFGKMIAQSTKAVKQRIQDADFVLCVKMIEECQAIARAQLVLRYRQLLAQRSEIVRLAQLMELRKMELEKALSRANDIDVVQAKATETMKRFDRSKRDVEMLKAKVQNAEDDLESGHGSQEKLEKAKSKLVAANLLLVQNRSAYEAAVSSLVELRQAGYPELRCAAAAKIDRFQNVPCVAFSDLSIVEKIGGGAFADVYRVELPVTGMCAFKQFRTNISEDDLTREAAAMWEMRFSERVVKLLMVCREAGKQGLLLELADGGSLGDLLHKRKSKLIESDILQILHDVATGLECLHHHQLVHLDVKADNVLLFGSRAKLADFGTAKQARNTFRDTKISLTYQWSAPEMLSALPKISSACDIWSFGMLMYEILAGSIPYESVEAHQLASTIAQGVLPIFPLGCDGVKPELVALMNQCWNADPTKRPRAIDLMNAIGDLMVIKCCSCMEEVSLAKGVFGKLQTFLCNACVPESVSASLTAGSIRSDGGLVLGQDVIEFQSFRHLLNKDHLAAWLKGQEEAAEIEVKKRLEVELEREKRKWESMTVDARIADCVLFDILPSRCPKCRDRLVFEGGCFALTCGSCTASFCAFCESVFPNGKSCHDHVPACKQNILKVPWYPNANIAVETFGRVQRVRQIREIKKKLENVDEDTRIRVIERIKNELTINGIKQNDLF